MSTPLVSIIMGSQSDLPVMSKAAEMLDSLQVDYEITIVSAHRTPDRMYSFAKEARGRGIKVIIAGAGGAAHLPGMVVALDGAKNAGILAAEILGTSDSVLSERLVKYKSDLTKKVLESVEKLDEQKSSN